MTAIKDGSMMIVYQDDQYYSIKFESIRDQIFTLAKPKTDDSDGLAGTIIPGKSLLYNEDTGLLNVGLAQRPDAVARTQGVPGLMWPGDGLSYDPDTGELSRDFDHGLEFKGTIGNDTEQGQVQGPALDDDTGSFYIVGDPDLGVLPNNWGSVSGEAVNAGDKVVRKYDGDWAIIADVSSSLSVFKIFSDTEALVVLDDVVNYPHLRVDNAVAPTVFSFSNQDGVGVFGDDGMDGLMSKEDKAYLDNLNVLIDQPFISSITPVEPLVTTEDKSGTNDRLIDVTIEINNSTPTSVGVVKLSDDDELASLMGSNGSSNSFDELNTLSTTQTFNNFVPKDFTNLVTLSSL